MTPLFKSHYSIGKSILTLEKSEKSVQNGPDSIIDIAKTGELKEIFLVDDCMAGFLEAYKNCQEAKLNLRFGVRLTICENMDKKDEESLSSEHRLIVFIKNSEGYKDLVKIYSKSAIDGFYYRPRIDCSTLKKMWSKNLLLAVPFYDSFIFNNVLTFSICIPEIDFAEATLFTESNLLPFDDLLANHVKSYAEKNKLPVESAKSIYYKDRKDFSAYLTFRCINNRSTLEKPQLDHMSSAEFCYESYLDHGRSSS